MSESGKADLAATRTMRFERLNDWLSWQETLHMNEIELGLERCREVAVRLGIAQVQYPVISVAGTNGKGSSVEMLRSILSAQGYRVGSYTSPHLLRYNERIRLLGEEVDDQTICEAFEQIDQARGDISLTYFEFSTLAAILIFSHAEIDVAILEVGLGGRLDAVNLLDADVALVTSIDLDHQDWLGDDREIIGREKAGIFRASQTAVCADPSPPESIRQVADELGTELFFMNEDFSFTRRQTAWSWQAGEQRYEDLPMPNLVGEFQLRNASGVLMALQGIRDKLPVSREAINHGLMHLQLQGRFQCIDGPVQLILDVAHNPQAAGQLVETLILSPVDGQTYLIFGMLKDKDVASVVRNLGEIADQWHIAGLQVERAMDTVSQRQIIENTLGNVAVYSYESIAAAYESVMQRAVKGDRVLVVGSFLTVSAVLQQLQDSRIV